VLRAERVSLCIALLGALSLAACDLGTVRKLDPATGKAIIEEEHEAFDARTWVATNWSSRVVPTVGKGAIPFSTLRSALAEIYLAERELSISEIAWLVGYGEVSSLTHAFKRWTGTTPRQFRLKTDGKSVAEMAPAG